MPRKSIKEQVAISAGGGALASSGRIPGSGMGKNKKNLLFQEEKEGKVRWKIKVDKELSDEMMAVLKKFLVFCQKKLQIQEPPVIYLLSRRAPGMTTGGYNPADNTVLALAEHRLLLDVLKTLAHELTHRKQHERGDLDNLEPRVDENDNSDLNTPYENEAYVNSGNFVKEFCRLYRGEEKDRLYSLHEAVSPFSGRGPKKKKKQNEPKPSEEEPFGNYLFGDERGLPNAPKSIEHNTEEEDELSSDLQNHFDGSMSDLDKWIPDLIQLKHEGKYLDFLEVPSKYKYAYRFIHSLSLEETAKILGFRPLTEPNTLFSGKTTILNPKKSPHQSWTVDFAIFEDIVEDWGGLQDTSIAREAIRNNKPIYLMFFRAPIHENDFLLNPDLTAPWSGHYDYQREVISVGPVKCDKVWYIQANEFYEKDSSNDEAKEKAYQSTWQHTSTQDKSFVKNFVTNLKSQK